MSRYVYKLAKGGGCHPRLTRLKMEKVIRSTACLARSYKDDNPVIYPPAVLGAERGDLRRLGQATEGRGGTRRGELFRYAVRSMVWPSGVVSTGIATADPLEHECEGFCRRRLHTEHRSVAFLSLDL
jgi:hypothetical protein